ncbi:hypothetical protein CSKR_113457 [Clonorchis sinensis]|uniref:Uncharacterized protein n=1 Tax=Clonorchis sinensis TaxID=79923 RepID=A0A419PN81_CLOSI|nr:hypothetical protein CSKR_113457 [Clonorchis sinensis]
MSLNVFGLFFIAVLHITIRTVSADYCGTVSCDVGKTFLYNTYCCTTSSGTLDCCKTFRSPLNDGHSKETPKSSLCRWKGFIEALMQERWRINVRRICRFRRLFRNWTSKRFFLMSLQCPLECLCFIFPWILYRFTLRECANVLLCERIYIPDKTVSK